MKSKEGHLQSFDRITVKLSTLYTRTLITYMRCYISLRIFFFIEALKMENMCKISEIQAIIN